MSEESDFEVEYGSADGISFVNATAIDSEGNEMKIPGCDKCTDGYRMLLIGKEHQAWVCSCGGQ